MSNKGDGKPPRGPLWILEGDQNDWPEVFTLDPNSDGGFLPVFSFREEAEAFLHLVVVADEGRKAREDWRIRETAPGELVSVLLGPCASVRRVTLDPPPVFEVEMLSLVSMDRKRFARYLMGRYLSVRESLGEKEIELVGHFQNSLAGDI